MAGKLKTNEICTAGTLKGSEFVNTRVLQNWGGKGRWLKSTELGESCLGSSQSPRPASPVYTDEQQPLTHSGGTLGAHSLWRRKPGLEAEQHSLGHKLCNKTPGIK